MNDLKEITLTPNDPTMFASCKKCNRSGLGVVLGDISCKAFTKREWRGTPVCENCSGPMVLLYEIKGDL